MSINPFFIFLSLVFWLSLWGPIGGLVAIPVLVWALVMLEARSEEKVTATSPSVANAAE